MLRVKCLQGPAGNRNEWNASGNKYPFKRAAATQPKLIVIIQTFVWEKKKLIFLLPILGSLPGTPVTNK